MKQNVFNIKTREKIDTSKYNTPVHSFIVAPDYFKDCDGINGFLNSYSVNYNEDVDNLRAYVFVFNSKSSEKFIKDSISNALQFIQM